MHTGEGMVKIELAVTIPSCIAHILGHAGAVYMLSECLLDEKY
jgi:hypothetical protein